MTALRWAAFAAPGAGGPRLASNAENANHRARSFTGLSRGRERGPGRRS